ncbi:hypothetical protein [Arthrobacter glacialis]|uniref:Phospholipase A2 domain-containing protein n=1 Tax=Arthrobacter glacialis TaxID=1664 RepID=A0A2S3ZS44_ARTGL|nr:hypothetical protein [Arthrobacter glacialis]POH72055.1 hypothetical protein CVS27_17910 [Arthrobacter glacialis]
MENLLKKYKQRKTQAWSALGVAVHMLLGGSPALAVPPSQNTNSLSSSAPATFNSKAKKSNNKEFDAQVSEALKFMRVAEGQDTYFDTAAAEASGADAATLEVGAIVNTLAAAQNSGRGDQVAAKLGLPIWGNWCGPGHGGGAAVDVLDSICRTHDKCYGSRGYFACSCDRAIISDINRNVNRMKTQERVTAAAVSVYFTYCMCNPFK